MTHLSISILISSLCFIHLFFFRPSIADNTNSSSLTLLQHFNSKDPSFESLVAPYGDAKLVADGNGGGLDSIRLASPGRVVYKKPIKLVEGKPKKLVSFSTHFSFSLPSERESHQGLAFVLLPSDFNLTEFDDATPFGLPREGKAKILSVKFASLEHGSNENDGSLRIHAGVDVVGLVSTRVRNVSSVDLTSRNGNDVSFAWVDYVASSKRLEVRIGHSNGSKPSDPLFWYPVDLSRLWANEEALVGFVGSSSSTIHSWGFDQRHVPQWMHSEPLDPKRADGGDSHSKPMKVGGGGGEKRRDCVTRILASLIFGVACGALTASTALYLWTIFGGNKRPVVPEESVVDFEYEKVKVVVDNKAIEDGSSKQLGA